MGWFKKCEGCEARREEITHLRAELEQVHRQNETLTKRLTEIADPGIDRRLRPPRPIDPAKVVPPSVPLPQYPGYERPPGKPAIEVE